MEIQTFTFFDLETTGLIQGKVMPKITEIALVAVKRESIYNCSKNSLPRILHKLVLPINPQKIIPPRVEDMTKLYNEDVQLLQPFECGIYELIMYFLQRLTPPICFVAHNGNRFDYPIFLWELECINKIFDDRILCIDTWPMFQEFFDKRDAEPKVIQDLLNDEFNDSLSTLDVDVPMRKERTNVLVKTMPTLQAIPSSNDRYTALANNEWHDIKEEYSNVPSPNSRREVNEKTPVNQLIRPQDASSTVIKRFKKNPRKKLNFGYERPFDMKLNSIHNYMFGVNSPQQHSAEADCLAMLRCVTNIAGFFVEWSDNNAIPLVYCKKKV
ncbi:uncharacterized protein [Linepithema humile]|uniref:uncharacterized protein n=1 Tax=Linepithema humile TaxID=83485 RepID=UPI00351F15C8